MKNKNAKLLIISFVLLIIAAIVFTIIFPANQVPIQLKKSAKNDENTALPIPSLSISPLEQIKSQTSTGYKLSKGVDIVYQKKSDSFIVFYSGNKSDAEKEVASFFDKFAINQNTLKISYIGTDLAPSEPPPGFGQF